MTAVRPPLTDVPAPTALDRLGFVLLTVYTFAVFSGTAEMLTFLHKLRPLLLIALLGLIIVAVTRGAQVLRNPQGIALTAFTCWMILCIPMSIWPGGAFQTVTDTWSRSFFSFFLAAGLINTASDSRKTVHTLAYAAILAALVALQANALDPTGRLYLKGTRFANPNDLAMILLAALPCIGYMILTGGPVRRFIGIASFGPMLLCILKTGSRAGLLGCALMVAIVFWRARPARKVLILLTVSGAALLMAVAVPDRVSERLFTVFGDEETADMSDEAIGSAYSRKALLIDSLILTAKNPLFGVGAEMFTVAQNELALNRGDKKGNWHVSHNMYTQLSSETGLPGFLFYMSAIVFCFRSLKRIAGLPPVNATVAQLRLIAETLRLSLTCFCAVTFFASVAYLPFVPMLCGVIVGLEHAVSREYLLLATAPRQPVPARRRPLFPGPRRLRPQTLAKTN